MRWIVLLLLFFGAIINFADKSIVGLAAVPIMEEFQLSYAEWGLVGSSYYWLFPITGIIGASMADRFGVKKVLGFIMITWTVLQFGVLAIAALPLLIVYRVLLGAFEGPYSPIAYSHADKWFPPKQRGLAISIVVSGGTIGGMVAAPLLVASIAIFGWKIAFAILGIASLVWFILFQFFTKENPAEGSKEIPQVKKKLEKIKLKDFLLLLASPTALFTTIAYVSSYVLVVWFPVWLPIYLVEAIKMTNTEMGFTVALVGIVSVGIYMGVSVLSDYLFKKSQNWRTGRVFIVSLSMALGALLFVSITIFQHPIWVITVLCLAKGLTYAIFPIGPTIMINEMPERRGLMTSILTSSGNMAGIVAPLVIGFIINLTGGSIMGYNYSIVFMAVIVLAASVLFAIFVKPSTAKVEEIPHDTVQAK